MKTPTRRHLLTIVALTIVTLLSSCSKHVSPSITSANTKSPVDSSLLAIKPVLKSVLIDTGNVAFKNRLPLVANDAYYNTKVSGKVSSFYKATAFQTKWLFDHGPGVLYYTVLDLLKNSDLNGLSPEDYDVAGIEARVSTLYRPEVTQKEIADLDIHISEMYFLYTTHLMEGRIRNVSNGKSIWKRVDKAVSSADVDLLAAASTPDDLASCISHAQPASDQYAKLRNALEYYRSLDKSSTEILPAVSVKSAVKPGERNGSIPLIRKKLSLTDTTQYPVAVDMAGIADSLLYDAVLADAVRKFQTRHGLLADGVIGEKTLRFLNQSFREKAELIALNMERLRWLPARYSDNYVVVNVPEFKLRVYKDQKQELEMRVIVGSSSKPTPIFTEQLEHIVFSPTWTVPVSIIKEEIIPHLRKDSSYYSNKNYLFYKNDEVIDPTLEPWKDATINPYAYRVIQNPGSDNSLGSVKFMMPNNLSVYLHDTPNHRLFTKDFRALSHGCVRLDEPAKFAQYLLRDQKGWTPERINKAMNDSTPSTIHLKKYYEVHIEYQTAWVDENGQVNFREDIYGHDKVQLRQLKPEVKTSTSVVGLK